MNELNDSAWFCHSNPELAAWLITISETRKMLWWGVHCIKSFFFQFFFVWYNLNNQFNYLKIHDLFFFSRRWQKGRREVRHVKPTSASHRRGLSKFADARWHVQVINFEVTLVALWIMSTAANFYLFLSNSNRTFRITKFFNKSLIRTVLFR